MRTTTSPFKNLIQVLSPLVLAALLIFGFGAGHAAAGDNYLYRVSVREFSDFTRLSFNVDHTPEHTLSVLPGKRVRFILRDTSGPLFKKLRAYSGPNISGIVVSRFGRHLQVTIGVREDAPGVRTPVAADSRVVILDIGRRFRPGGMTGILPGRERIRSGVDQLIASFDPPLKADVPFNPTDKRVLLKMLPDEQAKQFLAGEEALYKGRLSQAEEIFTAFARGEGQVRALALMRLGEACYGQHKYGEALKAFQEGERLWPDFVRSLPTSAFYYADSLVRNGDLQGGRRLMTRLIAEVAEKNYAPVVLVRLADILARQKKEVEALAIYRSVAANFPGNKANQQARMKLADRRFLQANPLNYQSLVAEYREIYDRGGDFVMREEALFKSALLESLFGGAGVALDMVMEYERKYPKGMYGQIVRSMREELLVPVFGELNEDDDASALIKFAVTHRDYLSRCIADPEFISGLHEAFQEEGRLKDENELYTLLVEKPWAVSQAPFMIRQIMVNAESLADYDLADRAGELFVYRFPRHGWAGSVRETLGRFSFQKRDMAGVLKRLSWLAAPNARAEFPESRYYLGKALEGDGRLKDAERSMGLFLDALKQGGGDSPLAPDAYYVAVSSRLAQGDAKGAMALLRAGVEAGGGARRDQFQYKLGELSLKAGDEKAAKASWDQVANKGTDQFWRKMASQALADLAARQHLKSKIGLSKK